MPNVQADPEKLKQFAKALVSSADKLQELARSLSRALDSSGWQDTERAKFEQNFTQSLKALGQISQKLKSEYAPEVQKKASALEQYRGR